MLKTSHKPSNLFLAWTPYCWISNLPLPIGFIESDMVQKTSSQAAQQRHLRSWQSDLSDSWSKQCKEGNCLFLLNLKLLVLYCRHVSCTSYFLFQGSLKCSLFCIKKVNEEKKMTYCVDGNNHNLTTRCHIAKEKTKLRLLRREMPMHMGRMLHVISTYETSQI